MAKKKAWIVQTELIKDYIDGTVEEVYKLGEAFKLTGIDSMGRTFRCK